MQDRAVYDEGYKMNETIDRIICVFLVVLALILWTYHLDLTPLGNDIVRDLLIAKGMIAGKGVYLSGVQASLSNATQATFGPLEYYLLLIGMMFSRSPAIITMVLVALNSIAVGLCYFLSKRFFNRRVAVIACLLYITNPWAAFYTRFIWNPNFVPFFTMLFICCLFKSVLEKKQAYILGACAALGALLQFHMITFFLFPMMLFVLKKENTKYIIGGVCIFLLVLSPYILHQVQSGRHIFEPVTDFASQRKQENSFLINVRDAVGIPVLLATNYMGKFMFGEKRITDNAGVNIIFLVLTAFMIIFFILGYFFVLAQSLEKKGKKYFMLFVWFTVPVLGFIALNKNISPHYGLMLYPVQFMMIGIVMDRIVTKLKMGKGMALILIGMIILGSGMSTFLFYKHVEREGGTTASYGIPYRFKLEAAKYIIDDARGKNPEVLLIRTPKKDFEYIFTEVLLKEPHYTFVSGTDELVQKKEGYLILDRFSRYGYHERELSEAENRLLDNARERRKFGGIEVIKLPLLGPD